VLLPVLQVLLPVLQAQPQVHRLFLRQQACWLRVLRSSLQRPFWRQQVWQQVPY